MLRSGSTIVIKIGSASLVDPVTLEPQLSVFDTIAQLVSDVRNSGHHAILVSSGAVAIGRGILHCFQKPKEAYRLRALAALGQSRLMSLWEAAFAKQGQLVAQVLLLNDEHMASEMKESAAMLHSLLQSGIVPIINENDAIAPGTFNGNDTVALVVAGLVKANVLAFLTDVDCLYTQNPRSNPDARAIEVVSDFQSLQADVSTRGTELGTGGMGAKILAANIASSMGITTIINNIAKAHNVVNILHNIHLDTTRRKHGQLHKSNNARCLKQNSRLFPFQRKKTSLHTIFLPAQNPTISPEAFSLLSVVGAA